MFWTSGTKSSCSKKFTDCEFGMGSILHIGLKLNQDNAGECVGVVVFDDFRYIAKTLPCKSKAFLACQGVTTQSTENANRETDVSVLI